MDADLQSVVAALAELTDSELRALIDATYRAPQIAPGLLAWIDALERLRELVLPQGGIIVSSRSPAVMKAMVHIAPPEVGHSSRSPSRDKSRANRLRY